MGLGDGLCIDEHVLVTHLVGMFLVKAVAQTVHKLQFGAQLKERQIKITTYTHLQKHVRTFEFDIVIVFSREIDHRIDTRHKIGTVVVETRARRYKIERTTHIGRLEVLRLDGWLS